MASKTEKTKKPTGLSIKRSGNTYTLSWKIGDKDYGDGQYFQYLINDTGKDSWQPAKNTGIGKTATSKSIKVDKAGFYPYRQSYLYEIGMRVKGNRKKYTTGSGKKKKTHSPGPSDWAEKRLTIEIPGKPSLSAALDEELTNVCTFSWSVDYSDTSAYIFTDVEWQTILIKNCSETDGSKISWSGAASGSAGASSYRTMTEDTSILYKDNNSYTRWFRVRSRGPRGASDWAYAKHVYALPNKAGSVTATAKETDEGGFQCTVDWSVGQSSGQKPIDKTTVQYSITTPDEDLTCPNGASWTDANISRDTADGDAAVFSIDDQLSKDQCLFIRVNTHHDSYVTYGKPVLASVGYLKDPTGLSVQTDNTTHKAIVSATNASEVDDSVLVVRYVPATGDPIECGIIEHGASSVTVTCPNWDEQSAIKFEVYAMVGTATKQERTDGVDAYSVSAKMLSQHTLSEGGAVPVAPQNVAVNRVEGKSDTIRVTWDWPWSEAGSAEISWSDHDDAWESTDEPETYLVNNLHASQWNISGLETGKTWYVRVRLIKGNAEDAENATYGPWSNIDQGMIDLSSAPNKPSLAIANPVLPQDGSTVVSWVYTSTDNTEQAYAEVAVIYSVYAKTTDIEVFLGKEYYTVVGTAVASPDAKDLNLYYELNNGVYIKTQDTEVVSGKTYYTIVAARVESPATASIGTYYEIKGQIYNPIAHTLTTQHVTIDAEAVGFTTGNIYNLACRVKSESGRISEWSDIVSLTIAESITCEIVQTSLVHDHIETNPRSFEKTDFLSFLTEQEEVFTKLQVDLSPIQDLHGYDSPWVGGAGKNKLPCTATSTTISGITFTRNDDGTYTANGTATANAGFQLYTGTNNTFDLANGNYILTGCPTGGGSNTYRIWVDDRNSAGTGNITSVADAGAGANITITQGKCRAYLFIASGQTVSNLVFKPMLRLATESDATFEPWENICPITGWTGCEVDVSGVNQWDENWELGNINSTTGANEASTNAIRSTNYVAVNPSTNYCVVTPQATILVFYYGADKSYITYQQFSTPSVPPVITTPSNCHYIRFRMGTGYGTTYNNDIAINYPSTVTTYQQGATVYSVSWQTEAGTVYGGTVDVVSGVLTVDRRHVVLDGVTNKVTGSYGSSAQRLIGFVISDQPATGVSVESLLCSSLKVSGSILTDENAIALGDGNTKIIPHIEGMQGIGGTYADNTALANAINTYLQSNPAECVYQLATPITYQLTPQKIQTLVGQNNVWSEDGEITARIAESARDISALKEMPLTVTAQGAGIGGITTITVKRAESYYLERPNEDVFNGHKDEVVATKTQLGQAQMSFDVGDLIGSLDDGATYKLIATIKDGLGQTAQNELDFEVHWAHQASVPSATIEIDETDLIAKITPTADDDVLYHYEKTTDTVIITGKTYYTRSGAGTEQSPYVYTAVQSPSTSSLSTYYEKLSYGDVADIYRELSLVRPM